jgi:short-subunit dehydrogenase
MCAKRKLEGKVVVITGASSGIGRATAIAFAEQGANVVLAARREHALRDLASTLEHRGVRALAVPTDVTDEGQVVRLATTAREKFGRIDIWVNNAGVSVLGRFEDVPLKDLRRVVETDLFGVLYGAHAVMPVFLDQGQGTLINVASMVAAVPQPYASAYVASKAAVRSLGASLRQELYLKKAKDVHVATVLPAVIDTPFFASAGNYTGRELLPPPPVNAPEIVANSIVAAAIEQRREVFVGRGSRFAAFQMRLMPGRVERASAKFIDRTHLGENPANPTSGNLFTPPTNNGSVSGGWSDVGRGSAATKRVATSAALGFLGLLLWRKAR